MPPDISQVSHLLPDMRISPSSTLVVADTGVLGVRFFMKNNSYEGVLEKLQKTQQDIRVSSGMYCWPAQMSKPFPSIHTISIHCCEKLMLRIIIPAACKECAYAACLRNLAFGFHGHKLPVRKQAAGLIAHMSDHLNFMVHCRIYRGPAALPR